jgi:hypothetical protein
MLVVLFYLTFGFLLANAVGPVFAAIVVFTVAGALLGAGLHALARQLELLRRAVAGCDHFIFGPPEEPKA